MKLFSHFPRKWNDIKLRNKLMIAFIFVVFIPVMIVGLFLTNELRQGAMKDAVEQTTVNMDRVKQRIMELLHVPIDISNKLLFDDRLRDLVNHKYETQFEMVQAYKDYPDFERYMQFSQEVANIKMYTQNTTMIMNWEFFPADDTIKSTAWYQSALNERGVIGWHYLEDETKDNEKFLSLVRRINFDNYLNENVLVITIDPSYLHSVVDSEPFDTLIVDDQNNIITANRENWINQQLTDIFPDIDLSHSGKLDTEWDGENVNIMIEELNPEASHNGLRVITIFSVDSIVKDANAFSRLGMSVILVSVIVALILIVWVSSLLTKRFLKLSKSISKVARGDLDTMVMIDGNDEFGQLSRQFNFMVRSIKELMQEVHETNMQKKQLELKQNEIKLKMMASQINPHFLFNALESIRMKAHIKGETEIAEVVKLLGRLMRKNLEVGGHQIAIKDEFEMVRCYLEIQKFRYGDRLNFDLELDPAAQQMLVPPLIIQPLVENAVIHGLEGKESGEGYLSVKASLVDHILQVEVSDNGVGISDSRMKAILQMLEDTEESSRNRIGMRNVHNRLQMLYGEEHGLKIDSKPGIGTTIRFSIPSGGVSVV
ncbi:sensor histidine kinase [Marinicrinis lubricantis]|uniref:histidine kinase n=1 Tax=Marinicrinis lubricantis TaxID=2086470 RepID=A0ABW1IL35_9BACL